VHCLWLIIKTVSACAAGITVLHASSLS